MSTQTRLTLSWSLTQNSRFRHVGTRILNLGAPGPGNDSLDKGSTFNIKVLNCWGLWPRSEEKKKGIARKLVILV